MVAVLLFLPYAWGAARSTHNLTVGPQRTQGDIEQRVFDCVGRTVENALPPGTRVAVHPEQGDELWPIRLAEFAFPRYDVVVPTRASYLLAVGPPGYGSCQGYTAGAFPAP